MKFLHISILLSVMLTSTASAWVLHKSVDAMTDEVSQSVTVKSTDGSKFTLLRKSNGYVWAYLELSGANQFMVNDRLMVRVDKNKAREANEDGNNTIVGLGGSPIWEWNANLIGYAAWHGIPAKGCHFLKELWDGQKMVIRYHPNQSSTKDLIFDISANKLAIPTSLGFKMADCVKPDWQK